MIGLTIALAVLNVMTVVGLVVHIHYARREEKSACAATLLLERILDKLEAR